MPSLNSLIFSMLLSAIVCGKIYAAVAYFKMRGENRKHLHWLIADAIGIGYIIGYLLLEKNPAFPPQKGFEWIFYFAILAIISSTFWDSSRKQRLITQFIYSVALPRILLDNPYFRHTWGPVEGMIWWVCLAIGIFIVWNIVERSFSTLPSGASVAFVYFGLSGATALILALSGTLRIAYHAGIIAALFGVIWFVTLVLQRVVKNVPESDWHILPLSLSPIIVFLLIGIWMNGYFFNEVPSASVLLIAVSPVFAQVGGIQVIQRLGERKSLFVQIGLIVLCVGVAVVIAVMRSGLFGQSTYY